MKSRRLVLSALLWIVPATLLAYTAEDYYKPALQYYQQGQFDQALQQCRYALQMDSRYWQAYQLMGYCYYRQKDNNRSIQAIDQSLQINPDNLDLQEFEQKLKAATPEVPPPPTSGTVPPPPPLADSSPTGNGQVPLPPAITNGSPSLQGGVNRNLPRRGKLVVELGDSDWVCSLNDLQDLLGGTINTSTTPIGVKISLGAALAVTPQFQLGLKFQYMSKEPVSVTDGYESLQFNENAIGGALEVEGVFPMGDGVNFIGGLEGGYYTLVASTLQGSGYAVGTDNLGGSAPGGMATAGIELLMNSGKTWALDLGLDYQFLTFTPVTYSTIINGVVQSPVTFKNATDGADSRFDFSGVGFFATARLF